MKSISVRADTVNTHVQVSVSDTGREGALLNARSAPLDPKSSELFLFTGALRAAD